MILNVVAIFMTLVQGIVLAHARLKEVIYRNYLYIEFISWFGILPPETNGENALLERPAIAILHQQLSIEMIYTILYAITEYTVGEIKSDKYQSYKNFDFVSFNQVLIDYMIVENPKKLQVGGVPDKDILQQTITQQKDMIQQTIT